MENFQQFTEQNVKPIIEFRGVSKTYQTGTHALDDVNIKINNGEFVFVVGSSGAGKSTFMKLIMREEKANTGKITVNGFDLTKMKRKDVPMLRRTMGIVFQDFRLIPTMSVSENIAFAMRATNIGEKDIKKRVPYILSLVGLTSKARKYPTQLSGGEQQRVALARALVHSPRLVIADEPTGNIDPELSIEIMELLKAINSVGTTVVVVTHEHDLAHRYAKRIIEIKDGKVVNDTAAKAVTV